MLAMAGIFLMNAIVRAREDQHRTVSMLTRWIEEGDGLSKAGRRLEAVSKFVDAAQLATRTPDFATQPVLVSGRDRALEKLRLLHLAIEADSRAEIFLTKADRIRIRFGGRKCRPKPTDSD